MLCTVALFILLIFYTRLFPSQSQILAGETPNATSDKILEIFNDCSCVVYYLCDNENFIIQDGRGLIQERFQDDNETIEKRKYPDRIPCSTLTTSCCKIRPEDDSKAASTTEKPATKDPGVRPTFKKKKQKMCGAPIPIFDVRLGSDEDVSLISGEFPWIAQIFYKTNSGGWKFKCAGSLIHPQAILTATHCIISNKAADLKVVVNGNNLQASVGLHAKDERDVREIVKHPDYYSGGFHNDVAILILTQAYNVSNLHSIINTVCLPEDGQKFENLVCRASIWDRSGRTDGKLLKQVILPLVSNEECESKLRNTRLGKQFELDASFICAGGEKGKDACKGDGGNPLVCQIGNNFFQVGIVSWGIDCGFNDVPGVYTNVMKMSGWIRNTMKVKKLALNALQNP